MSADMPRETVVRVMRSYAIYARTFMPGETFKGRLIWGEPWQKVIFLTDAGDHLGPPTSTRLRDYSLIVERCTNWEELSPLELLAREADSEQA